MKAKITFEFEILDRDFSEQKLAEYFAQAAFMVRDTIKEGAELCLEKSCKIKEPNVMCDAKVELEQ